MKKLIILSIVLLSLQLSAQNVELTIEPNSIKVQDDYLYFKYRLQNNSDTSFVFYDVGMVDVATSEDPYIWNMYANRSGLSCFIYDENGKFRPRTFTGVRDNFNVYKPIVETYEDSIRRIYSGKYIILNQGDFVEYEMRLIIIEDYVEYIKLEKGTYKFKLKYGFSLDNYRQQYLRARQINDILFLFDGEIWSDFYLFEYP